MGVNLVGLKPSTEEGKRFDYNWWNWRPVASYALQVAPSVAAKVEYWGSNDGDGLKTQEDCDELAKALEIAAANKVEWKRDGNLPADSYHFDFDSIREFAAFLRGCGGFEIW